MGRVWMTIEREYGSGGTQIARELSAQTGIPCYGREILEDVSKKYGLSVEDIERYEETMTNSFMYSFYVMGRASAGEADMLAREGHIYVAEHAAIQRFASQGSSVFIGHCAARALEGYPNVIKVFIRSSDSAKKNCRIKEEYGVSEREIERTRKWFDKKRAHYYQANTGLRWDDLTKYDIVLDSAALGIDGCVAALGGIVHERK